MYYILYNNCIAFEADISSCNFKHISEKKGDSFPYADESSEILVLNDFDKIVYNVNTCNNCVWNKLFKRRLFDNIRFPEGKLFEDIFTMHKLIERANRVVFSFECKYNYLLRDGGITLSKFNIK